MSERPSHDPPTVDLLLPEHLARIRERFKAAWEACLQGGPAPNLDDFLAGVPGPDQTTLRRALEKIEQAFAQRRTIDLPRNPPLGTVDFRPEPQKRPAVSPADPAGTIDLPKPQPGATMDFTPELASPSQGTVDDLSAKDSSADLSGTGAAVAPEPEEELPTVAGYQILGVLGRGAMGVVYKARQRGLKRVVALKMILAGGHASELDLARFRSEAEAVGQLQHPNIVQVHEVGEADGCPFFSLEYVDAGSLQKKLGGTPQPVRPAADLIMMLAQAMDFAHQKGIVHRDLKPANVMLASARRAGSSESSTLTLSLAEQVYGIPKIADFGLAKRLEEESGQTRSGTILGTPSYMAPEQAEGKSKNVGPLADVYALGAILYEMLTGRPPFRGETMWDTLEQVRTQEPVPPTRLQPKVPRDLETICLKALQKEPGKRYASAGALAEDLRRFLAGEPIQARPVGNVERFWRWCRRNPRVATLSGAVLLLLVAISVGSTWAAFTIAAEKEEAVRQEDIAKKKAKEAQEQRKIAEDNATRARAAEKQAQKNAEIASEQRGLALKALGKLVFEVQRALKDSNELSDEMRALRKTLLDTALAGLTDVAASAAKNPWIISENPGATERSIAQAHMQMANIFSQLNRSREALDQYKTAHAILDALARAEPDNDKNLGNLALSFAKLGDISLELAEGAKQAQHYYLKAFELRKTIAEKKSNFYKPEEAKRMLADSYNKLGIVAVRLGDPTEGKKQYEEALRLYKELEPTLKTGERVGFLARSYQALADVSWRLGDEKGARAYYDEVIKQYDSLGPKFRAGLEGKRVFAITYSRYGDLSLRFHKLEEARKYYQQSLDLIEELVKRDSRAEFRWLRGQGYYRYATVALALRDGATAQKYYELALKDHQELARADDKDDPGRTEVMLALARCGRHTEASAIAARLRKARPDATEVQLQVAAGYAVCAGAVRDDVILREQYTRLAVDVLEQLTANDYQDVASLETNPDLDPIREDVRFRKLIAGLKERMQK